MQRSQIKPSADQALLDFRGLFEGDYEEWSPPEHLFELLVAHGKRTRDKVEMVIAFYAVQHHGQHPTDTDVGKVLSISRQRVDQAKIQLVAAGRATKKHGKFALKLGRYTNPVSSLLLKQLGMDEDP